MSSNGCQGYIPRGGLAECVLFHLELPDGSWDQLNGEPSHLWCPWAPVSPPVFQHLLLSGFLAVARLMGLWGMSLVFSFLWLLCRCACLRVLVTGKDYTDFIFLCKLPSHRFWSFFSFLLFFSCWFEGIQIYMIYVYMFSILFFKNVFVYFWPCWSLRQHRLSLVLVLGLVVVVASLCCGARALGWRAAAAACGSQALEHRLNSCAGA